MPNDQVSSEQVASEVLQDIKKNIEKIITRCGIALVIMVVITAAVWITIGATDGYANSKLSIFFLAVMFMIGTILFAAAIAFDHVNGWIRGDEDGTAIPGWFFVFIVFGLSAVTLSAFAVAAFGY